MQIPRGLPSHQFSAADLPCSIIQIATLEITQNNLTNHATRERIQTYAIKTEQAIGTRIIADRTVCIKGRTRIKSITSSGTHRLCRFVSGTARQLRAQTELYSRRAINDVMQLVLVGDILLPRDPSTIASRLIECHLSSTQCGSSRSIKRQLYAYCSCGERLFRQRSIAHVYTICTMEAAFLRTPEGGGFLPYFL